MAFVRETKPRVLFSFHCLASICGPSFFASKYASDDGAFAERSRPLLSAYTRGFYAGEEKPVQLNHACSSGSLPTWLYRERSIPGFDLEWEGEERSKLSHTDRTTPELLNEYRDRHYFGILTLLREMGASGATEPAL
ncbi:hypothetical protein [Paenibacillus sp. GYB003]|uniref:hypothetical protein n=1 Tax=Paenibacillus sp. GYB003 TaxID=2994392 RepID=UPI002F9625E3